MPCVVVVECGREIRTAFVSDMDGNGDERTEAAASIIAGFRVGGYILATGPMPDEDVKPTLWPFPLSAVLDLHTHLARFQRRIGRGHGSFRVAVFKAISGTARTVTPDEISAYLKPPALAPVRKGKMKPSHAPASPTGKAVQLALF